MPLKKSVRQHAKQHFGMASTASHAGTPRTCLAMNLFFYGVDAQNPAPVDRQFMPLLTRALYIPGG